MNILIIGGSRGIGKAAARELVKDGHHLLVTGRNTETLETVKREFPDAILSFSADITREAEVDELIDFVKEGFPPDGVILNAASFSDPETGRSVTAPKAQELTEILDANVVAHYRLVQKLLPLLKKRGRGRIVMIGSTAGIRRDKGGIYGISKWALRSYAYQLREEVKEYGIGVSLINPGGTFTETRRKHGEDDTRLLETSDLGILIAALFRLSPQAVVEQLDVRPLEGDTY